MTNDIKITTPSLRWGLYARANGSYYVTRPMGGIVEIQEAYGPVFLICAEGLGVTPNELSRLCDLCPPTTPNPIAEPAS